MNTNNIHEGRNIKRFREMLGMKQEALAIELGGDWTQKRVSLLEQKDQIERNILEEVSKALKMPVEALESFDNDTAVNIISNTFTSTSNDASTLNVITPHCTFNPVDKVVELFERLLDSEKEKTQLMKDILEKLR